MAGIAKVTLVGNLGRDPETRYTPNGAMNVQFTIAVNRTTRDQSGQSQERTNWYRVTAWDRLAERLDSMVQKGWIARGRLLYVEGDLEAREYQDQQGQTRTSLDVRMTDWAFVGSRQDNEGGQGGSAGQAGPGGQAGGGGRGGYGNQSEGEDFGNGADDYTDVPF